MGRTRQQWEALEARLVAVLTAEPDLTTRQLTERFRCSAHRVHAARKRMGIESPGSNDLLGRKEMDNSKINKMVPSQPMRTFYRR